MLRDRLLTAALALPLLVVCICCAPVWVFSATVFLLTCLGLYEFFSLTRDHNPLPCGLGLGWGSGLAAAMCVGPGALVGAVLTAGFFLTFAWALRTPQPDRGLAGVSLTLLGVVYVGFLLPHLVWVRQLPDGVGWVFFLLLVAMLGDTGGYAVGRLWGTRKLIPHISPGKTLEGSAGALLGSLGAAWVSWVWLLPERSWTELGVLAAVLAILAQIGDLCESAVKRACGAKDSGRLFPGHGGLLDRADSLLFPAAFIYYYGALWA